MEVAKRAYHTSVILTLCVTFPLYTGGLPISMSTTHMTITAPPLLMTNRTTIQQMRKRQLPPTTINTRMINLVKKCTQWDDWVNSNTPDGSGDYEPFDIVAKHSKLCTNPIKIECLTTSGFQADDLGQIITCDLCSGLQCDNVNQFDPSGCADYKVRLACLKLTPECAPPQIATTTVATLSSTTLTTNPPIKTLAKCYTDMDTSYCPDSCPDGQYCDGTECVLKSDCNCKIDGTFVESETFVNVKGRDCDECWCSNGTIECYPFICPSSCQFDETEIEDLSSCTCTCEKTCAYNEFRCDDETCIPVAKQCDGIFDCASFEDEDYCVTPAPTPPPTAVPITTLTSPSISAVTTSRTCTYKGIQYTAGQQWYDGCYYRCKCMEETSGQYKCEERCPRYPQIPLNCVLVQDFRDPCCTIPSCSTVAPTPMPKFNVCIRNGKAYTQGQKWFEGCDRICVCEDGKTGHYSCMHRCPTFATISPKCIMVTDPSDPLCCQIPQCTTPKKSTIPQGTFVQGAGLDLTPIPNLQQTQGGVKTPIPQPNRYPTPYPGGTYAPDMIQSHISTLLPNPILTPNHPTPQLQPISMAPTTRPTNVVRTTLKKQSTSPVTINSHNTQQFDNIKSSSTITRTETSDHNVHNSGQEKNREDMIDVDTLCQFEFWIYILIGFGSCLVFVFIIWLFWFCVRTNNAKVSDRKQRY